MSLRYDALGRCIERTDANYRVHFVWDGNVPLHEVQVARPAESAGETTAPWPTPLDLARVEGGPVKTWLFSPDDRTLLGKLESEEDGTVDPARTGYAVTNQVGLPCAMLAPDGTPTWKDDGWRARRGCFVQGTLVSTSEAGLVPIDAVGLGEKMTTVHAFRARSLGAKLKAGAQKALAVAASVAAMLLPGMTPAEAAARAPLAEAGDAEGFQQAVLHFAGDGDEGHGYELELLRPQAWFAEQGAHQPGDRFRLELDELKVAGWATVASIAETEAKGGQRAVVMHLRHEVGADDGRHLSNDVYEVSFVEGGEALRGTGGHPLYSLDRDDWVRIRDLQVGERLQTGEGAVTVEALEKVRGVHRVYNLEVEGDHEYLVGEAGVRAHNTDPPHWVQPPVTYGKNELTKLKKHSQHMRETARAFDVDIPKSPSKPTTQSAMRTWIESVVDEGETRQGRYMTIENALWSKKGDGVVVRRSNGEFVTYLDYSKGDVAHGWDNAQVVRRAPKCSK